MEYQVSEKVRESFEKLTGMKRFRRLWPLWRRITRILWRSRLS